MQISIASKCAFNFTNVTDLLLHFLQIQSDKVTFWLSLQSHQLPSVVMNERFPFWCHPVHITEFSSLSALTIILYLWSNFRHTWTVIKHSIQQHINSACCEPALSKHGHPTKDDDFSFCNMGHSKSVIINLNYVHKEHPYCTCISGFVGMKEIIPRNGCVVWGSDCLHSRRNI